MILLVTYDIINTKHRNRVVSVLESYFFYRLQYSVYIGNIHDTALHTFEIELRNKISKKDSIFLIPMTKKMVTKITTLGENKRHILQVVKKNEFEFKDIIV